MKRRNFLRTAGAFSLASLAPLTGIRASGYTKLTSLINEDSDKILILVHLFGGNDGLNTLFPLDQYENLATVRGNLTVRQSRLLTITDKLALHTNMTGMRDMFNEGTLGIIQNVGYPDQNRSHFRSTDIWNSGSKADEIDTTGWIGRHLDGVLPGFPANYPNANEPHPPAISMGNIAHATCEGMNINYSQTVDDPGDVTLLDPADDSQLPNDRYGEELEFLRTITRQTNAYGGLIQDAYDTGSNEVTYPSGNGLATQLKKVARMIDGGLETKVYTVYLGGFDTHAEQADDHADLLKDVSDAIAAFQEDISISGHSERVLGLTFSEFGRRIRPNGSNGTDHGTAGPMFLFGNCISNQVVGDNPTIDPEVNQTAGVDMKIDFRDIYGSILKDWFNVSETRVRNLFHEGFTYLPIVDACNQVLPVDLFDFIVTSLGKSAKLSWKTAEEIDNSGFEVERSTDGRNFSFVGWVPAATRTGTGINDYEFIDEGITVGPLYYYRLKQVSIDGAFEYSPIQTIRLTGTAANEWSIGQPFPNPASDRVAITCYSPNDATITYSMFNAVGQQVMADSHYMVGRRESVVSIDLGRLPKGVYILKVDTHSNGEHSRRVVIQ